MLRQSTESSDSLSGGLLALVDRCLLALARKVKPLQNRAYAQSPLLKTTALRRNLTLGDPCSSHMAAGEAICSSREACEIQNCFSREACEVQNLFES